MTSGDIEPNPGPTNGSTDAPLQMPRDEAPTMTQEAAPRWALAGFLPEDDPMMPPPMTGPHPPPSPQTVPDNCGDSLPTEQRILAGFLPEEKLTTTAETDVVEPLQLMAQPIPIDIHFGRGSSTIDPPLTAIPESLFLDNCGDIPTHDLPLPPQGPVLDTCGGPLDERTIGPTVRSKSSPPGTLPYP